MIKEGKVVVETNNNKGFRKYILDKKDLEKFINELECTRNKISYTE